jgi:nucleoprotein TPR
MCAIVQTHLNQVENDYKERLERELSARNQFEKVDAICFNLLIVNVFSMKR